MAGISLFYKVLEIAKDEKFENEQTVKDLITLIKNELPRDRDKGLVFGKHLKDNLDKCMKQPNRANKQFIYNSFFSVLVAESRYSFDSYFRALEWRRPIEEQFYLPRRKQLKPIVDGLERLLITKEIDELFTSEPPRVGKTTLAVFITTWIIGVNSELANLYCSCSGQLVNAFYKGINEILNDSNTYNWKLIFPNVKFDPNTFVNSKECFLDTGRIKRYHSFTGRSIDAESLNGACDCNGILIADDLVSGIEEAINKERLGMLNMKVNSNLLTRAKMGAKIWWIGTRWSLGDPIQVRLNSLENTNRRYDLVNIPALDENDESNFNYLYGVGFDTEYFRMRRESFISMDDSASWYALYMGQPVERSGLLFPVEELNYFNGILPEEAPDRIFGFCDIAWGGGDYTVLPILYQYGEICYCVDFVCDNGDKKITIPKVIKAIEKYNMGSVQFEKNSGGANYKEDIEKELARKGIILNITTKRAFSVQKKYANSKETHIFEKAPEIKEIIFLDRHLQTGDYRKAMGMLCSYTIGGKRQHDDVPDALSGSMDMKNDFRRQTSIRAMQRLF